VAAEGAFHGGSVGKAVGFVQRSALKNYQI
jgi:hypothetical protein